MVLASERYLNERELYKNKPQIKGYGHRTTPMLFDRKMADNDGSRYILSCTRQACVDADRRSGMSADVFDVFEINNCFTSSEYVAISVFGLTEPGKEYEAVELGMIAFVWK